MKTTIRCTKSPCSAVSRAACGISSRKVRPSSGSPLWRIVDGDHAKQERFTFLSPLLFFDRPIAARQAAGLQKGVDDIGEHTRRRIVKAIRRKRLTVSNRAGRKDCAVVGGGEICHVGTDAIVKGAGETRISVEQLFSYQYVIVGMPT